MSIHNYINECLTEKRSQIKKNNVCESVLFMIEGAKIINKTNPNGCGYPCSNLKFKGINISIRDHKGIDMEKQLLQLEKDYPIMKSIFEKKYKEVFIPWVKGKDEISDHDIIKGLKLYDIEYHYSEKNNKSEFEFCYEAINGSNVKKILDVVAFNMEIIDGKIDKCSAHLI